MRRIASIILLVVLCYVLALGSVIYFPIGPGQLGAFLTKLLHGQVRPLKVQKKFNETICYVTDRKMGPRNGDNVSYLGEYAGAPSYGRINVQIPNDHSLASPLGSDAVKKVEPLSSQDFVSVLQSQAAKPLIVWIHGYRASFNKSTAHCAQIAHDLNIDANFLSFDWASSESTFGYTRDVIQLKRSTKHLANLLETIKNEVKPAKLVVIAHSLGTQLVCLALQKLYNDPNARDLKLDHVIFLAPNIDREDFDQNFKSQLQGFVKRLTIYVAADDNALLLSKLLHNVDSIGLPEEFSPDTNLDEIQAFLYYGKDLPDKVDIVDLSFSKKEFLKHRVFLERPVLEDLFWLIKEDQPAATRHLLKYDGSKRATNYWVIPP